MHIKNMKNITGGMYYDYIFVRRIGLGSLIFFDCNGKEELDPFVLLITIGFMILGVIFVLNADYNTKITRNLTYPLQQISDGSYYNTSGNKINVMTLDGNIQKPKTIFLVKMLIL